ncbi:uncharacterized protein LOC128392654 [Panonychus citri]|uniref:uncharacterized protein LOC128392654 n=1 Tax=Panonychus citri TaxID=50023 RepID=UPI002307AB73|nr:uncharacterized protein LOC128392654 [Panonychus citri]
MKVINLFGLFVFIVILQSTCSIIITSVYAGRKKFKTFSFDWLFPPIVLERANKLGFSFNGHYRLQKPNFRIKFNMPLKFPIHMNYANNYDEIDDNSQPTPSDYNGLGMPDAGAHDHEDTNEPNHDSNGGEYADSNQNPSQYESTDQGDANQPDESDNKPEQYPVYNDKPKFKVTPIITLGGKLPNEYEPSSSNVKVATGQGVSPDKIPYTGKAQVSSFIDNGQFINAHQTNVIMKNEPSKNTQGGLVDEAFEDQLEGAYGKSAVSSSSSSTSSSSPATSESSPRQSKFTLESIREEKADSNNQPIDQGSRREDTRRSKIIAPLMVAKKIKMLKIPLYAKKLALNDYSKIHTVRLGYKGAPAESSFLTQYEATPDVVPLSLPQSKYSNYYSSLSFTNGMHGIPYEPVGFGPFGTIKWISRMFNKPGNVAPPVKYRLPTKHVHLG